MTLKFLTFGFKYGLPKETDMMFDVRFLTNPFYVDGLREQTGLDAPVSDYVFSFENSREFFERLCGFLDFVIPQFQRDGREKLTIAIGCTGGRHRSVAVAERLARHFKAEAGHRDITEAN